MKHSFRSYLMSGVFLTAGSLTATAQEVALSQELAVTDSVAVQQLITVTGSRGKPRTVADSAVPIDVLDEATINDVSFTDTNDVLKTLVPSYTIAREPISDGSTFIRPAALRGLSSDKTLVLVNSKRRHRAALVTIGGSGTQGPDVATIPASALKTVEILRDGAAAQYGSDAIAGVINFILKDDADGAQITVQGGQSYEGDGEDLLISGNIGLGLGTNGFINISVEGTSTQPTHRGKEWESGQSSFDVADYIAANPDTAYLFGSGEDFDTSNVQLWGQPESKAFRSFVNMGYTLPGGQELYAFANYSASSADGDFNYRFPTNSVNAPFIRLQDGATFKFSDRFPAGFTPRFFGDVIDYSTTAGIRGDFTPAFSYDFSARYGKNQIDYKLTDTVNPSLGNASPESFHPGDLISDEVAVAADFVYEYAMSGLASPVDFSFGAEWRDEGYELVKGDEASYIAGPYAFADPWNFCDANAPTAGGAAVIAGGSSLNCGNYDTDTDGSGPDIDEDGFAGIDPVYTVNGVGSNGFPGYSPDYSGSLTRDSYGIYAGASTDLTESLFVEIAGRFENYSDFGETTNGKIAARWSITPEINLRGSVGTGFRAPTPGQLATTNVSTRFPAGEPVASGLFPASNPVSQFLGAEELKPEESTNYSLGATGSFGPLGLTLDFYKIDISDQFYATRSITVTPEIRDELLAANVPGADTIGAVQFFQNAFDSTTEGVDFVATYVADWGASGETAFTLSSNYNSFSVEQVNIADLFREEDVFDFENGRPDFRTTFAATHSIGAYTFLGRANYYGSYTASQCFTGAAADGFSCPGGLIKQELGSEVLFDIEVSYALDDTTRFTLGARNVLDEYPDEGDPALGETGNGRIYRSDSIVDWQGGFVYLKASKSF